MSLKSPHTSDPPLGDRHLTGFQFLLVLGHQKSGEDEPHHQQGRDLDIAEHLAVLLMRVAMHTVHGDLVFVSFGAVHGRIVTMFLPILLVFVACPG